MQPPLENPTSNLRRWIDGFITSRRSEGMRPRTLAMYTQALNNFVDYCKSNDTDTIGAITPVLLRGYILHLQDTGHNPGGVRWFYRQVKAFMNWYEQEDAPDNWRNPVRKVKTPNVPEKILDPVSLDDVALLIKTCDSGLVGIRDKAVLLTLIDTGARAGELTGFDLHDLDRVTGALIIRASKTGKGRTVFLGKRARRAVRAYLKLRGNAPGALFLTRSNTRLTYAGLRQITRRRAAMVGIPEPPLHSFRRACGINLIRSGESAFAAQNLLGHSDLKTTKQYVKLVAEDLRAVIERSSPGDKL